MIRKKLLLLSSAFIMASCMFSNTVSAETNFSIKKVPYSERYLDYLENPQKYSIAPPKIDGSLNSPIEVETELPESFDLRSQGLVSSVKDQGIYGTCWAHSAIASMETSLIEKNPDIDISEWHMAYFCTIPPEDVHIYACDENMDFKILFERGGLDEMIIGSIVNWQGITSEENFPYESTNITNEDYRYLTDYHVSSAYTSFINDNQVAKEILYNGNIITMVFLSHDNYYNPETSAYYTYKDFTECYFHAVSVVGWDDNYPKENFNVQPENDGAWLIKNSWGDEWGNNGYCWISYEDVSICFDTTYNIEYKENYDNIYYNGKTGNNIEYYTVMECSNLYSGNIFTAERDEYISGAGFYTYDNGDEYEVTIYTDIQDENDPTSGTPCISVSGTEKYSGYHTIDFYEGIYIEEGTKYSIVIETNNPTISLVDDSDLAENISFISKNGEEWQDTSSVYNQDSESYSLIGYVNCKVFTNNVDKIEFSEYAPYVYKNEKITLKSDNGQDIYYSLNGTEWNLYTEPIVIEDDTTVYASFSADGTNAVQQTYSIMTAELKKLKYVDVNAIGYEEWKNIDIENNKEVIKQEIPTYLNEICMYTEKSPYSEITINGEKIVAGKEFTISTENDVTDLKIIVSGENQNSTEYNIQLVKSNIGYIDYNMESIIFDENSVSFFTENGTELHNNDSLWEYFGQTLTGVYKDGSGEFTVQVPERAVRKPLEIKNYTTNTIIFKKSEGLNYFLSDCETGEGIDYSAVNAYYRLEPDIYYGLDYYQDATNGQFSSITQYYLLKIQSADKSLKIYTYGDLDGDNQITSYDALLILQNATGLYNFDNEIEFFADSDLNSKIDSYDSLLVLQYITENINDLPKFEVE